MYTEKQIKGYAKALRNALASRGANYSHSECLELIAETIGEKSWNHLSAKLFKNDVVQAIPEGWSLIGENKDHYNVRFNSDNQGKSKVLEMSGQKGVARAFISLMQTIQARSYLAQHVKMTAKVKTDDVVYASLWIRVDGEGAKSTLAFDNMYDVPPRRALQGTNDWVPLQLVLNVPDGASTIHFGCLMSGGGAAYFKDITFQAVSTDVPVSGGARPDKPSNLSFD